MSGNQLSAARHHLGLVWGLERPLTREEMGACLQLSARNLDTAIRDYERGKSARTDRMAEDVTTLLDRKVPPPWLPPKLRGA